MRRVHTYSHWAFLIFALAGLTLGAGNGRLDAAPPDSPAPQAPLPSAWTDPRIIVELAKSCAFDPDLLKGDERAAWIEPQQMGDNSPLSCSASFEQSCTYDPCFVSEESHCKPRCSSSCRECGKGCAKSCESCKRQCKDDACRLGCATSCAKCHETCVRNRDRCTTGTCTQEYRQCRFKLKRDWAAMGCPKVCRDYLQCQERCAAKVKDEGEVYDKCGKPCQPADRKGCDIALCGGRFGMGIDPRKYPEGD